MNEASQRLAKKSQNIIYNKGLEFRIYKELPQISHEIQKGLKIGKYLIYSSER